MENEEFDFHEIKTFEDACRRLGISAEPLLVDSLGDTEAFLQANAFYKLMIIQKAINNGVLLDKGGWRYHPYWELYPKREIERMNEDDMQRNGIRRLLTCADAPDTDFSGVRRAGTCSSGISFMFTDCSSSLCFNSKEAAIYAAHQFEDLFFQYYGIKVKS